MGVKSICDFYDIYTSGKLTGLLYNIGVASADDFSRFRSLAESVVTLVTKHTTEPIEFD